MTYQEEKLLFSEKRQCLVVDLDGIIKETEATIFKWEEGDSIYDIHPFFEILKSFIETFEKAHYYHYDFYSQALMKIIRNYPRDRRDVEGMIQGKRVKLDSLLEMVASVEQEFLKYPRLD